MSIERERDMSDREIKSSAGRVFGTAEREREGEGEIRSYAGRVLEGEKEREGGRGERK